MLFDKAKPLETMVAGATLCPVNDAFTLDVCCNSSASVIFISKFAWLQPPIYFVTLW